MKLTYKTFLYGALAASLSLGSVACTDYLDKEPDSTIKEEEAFKNFKNFQGFVEEIYNCIPNKESCYWCTSFNWGEDELFNTGEGDSHFTRQVDLGNYRAWSTNGQLWLFRGGSDPTSGDKFNHSLWPHAWYCIRKCNIGLEHLDYLVDASQKEKDAIAGQLYFFRAWWHEELIQYFGGLPYIDEVLPAGGDLQRERLSYKECAARCAEDFRKAAELLPLNWDKEPYGSATLGNNDLRVNKIMALGYLGKVELWAASPLMQEEKAPTLDGSHTYKYDAELAKKAAEDLGTLLQLVEDGKTQYALAEFDYSNIYNHEKSASAKTCYTDIFYTTQQNWKGAGTSEAIFRGPLTPSNGSNWNFAKLWGPKINKLVEHDNIIHQPTANYVNYYGMANGLPLNDPESGFDPEHPFQGRDPRFYHDIVFDGFRYVVNDITDKADKPLQYCTLYTGGLMRNDNLGSRTGYFCQKLVPHQCNKYDDFYGWSHSLSAYLPYMRLADVYLMYAEACAAAGGRTYKANSFSKNSVDAINTLRDRVGVEHVADKFTGNAYMDEIRRERAVELAFEGFRFNDLQRWLLLTVYPYNVKTSQEFTRAEADDYFNGKNDPADAKVSGWSEKVILERVYSAKHYWFPLLDSDVYLYEDFQQNPGW